MGQAFRQKNAAAVRLGGGMSVNQAAAIGHAEQRRAAEHRGRYAAGHLDHSQVSKWTRGERKDYR